MNDQIDIANSASGQAAIGREVILAGDVDSFIELLQAAVAGGYSDAMVLALLTQAPPDGETIDLGFIPASITEAIEANGTALTAALNALRAERAIITGSI